MNKKAASVLMMIFEILIVLFVVFTVIQIARAYANSETVNKEVLANDIEMMVNAMVGTPGDIMAEYPGNVSKYIFILNSESIKVFIKGDSEQGKVIKTFFLPQGYEAFGTLEEKENLCLKKEKRKILLLECDKSVLT